MPLGAYSTANVSNGAGTVNATVASAVALAANPNARVRVIQNDSDTVVYLGLGTPAVLNRGVRLAPGGSVRFTPSTGLFSGVINAIHGGTGNKVLTYVEF